MAMPPDPAQPAPLSPPPITPDDKNWTWVLERVCPDCGFDAAVTPASAVPGLVRDQVVTMQSPRELAGQLEALSASVDALAARQRDGDAAIQKLERELAGELSR